jgi:Fe-S oxidoreductase
VFEPPRKVLGSIPKLELREPILNKEHAVCCGAGGGLWMYNKDLAEKIAVSKIKGEIEPLHVDGIVTGCPNCILSLKYASAETGLNIFDISEIVDRCL